MARSKSSICNLALAMVGAEAIRDIEENNTRARLLRAMYEQARAQVIGLFDWPFARGFTKLEQRVDVQVPNGLYAYSLPSGCVVPRDLYPRNSDISWEWMSDYIVTTLTEEVYLYYTRDEDNPTKYSNTFATTLAELLAAWIAFPITGDKKLADNKANVYGTNLLNTLAVEANTGNEYRHSNENPNYDTFNTGGGFPIGGLTDV